MESESMHKIFLVHRSDLKDNNVYTYIQRNKSIDFSLIINEVVSRKTADILKRKGWDVLMYIMYTFSQVIKGFCKAEISYHAPFFLNMSTIFLKASSLFIGMSHPYLYSYFLIKNILIRRKESDTYLATVSRHRWNSWITMKKDEIL